MSPEDRRALLILAREAAAAAVTGAAPPGAPASPTLAAQGAAFVTLRVRGELRGCIGHVQAQGPLWQCVRDMARAAAERDGRFPPVDASELADLTADVSVLTPLTRATPDDVRIGSHGVYLRLGAATGLLLPQVAVEWGWDRDELLRQVSQKAGLPPDAWRHPEAELYTFEAEVIKED
jgi:AmmeMemoRadiSam system protein A